MKTALEILAGVVVVGMAAATVGETGPAMIAGAMLMGLVLGGVRFAAWCGR